MAFTKKFTNIKRTIEAAYRDSGLKQIDYESAIEWTAELLGLLGVPATNIEKVTNGKFGHPDFIRVENYRFRLPDDIVSLTSMRRVDFDDNGNITTSAEMVEVEDLIQTDIVGQDPQFFKYKNNGKYIFTEFSDGWVEVTYDGVPIDEEGLPLVPDDPKMLEALKYHIIFHNDWINWRRNPASPGLRALINDSEQRRDFYVGAARNKARIPTVDQMEALKNQWLRVIPRTDEHYNSFNTLANKERIYTYRNK